MGLKLEKERGRKITIKKLSFPFLIIGFFYILGMLLWLILGKVFYLLNFMIIGTVIGLGIGLWPILSKKLQKSK